jgi:chaperonin GroEL
MLLRAMEEPMRTVVANAGHDASETMAYVKLAGRGHGFDVRSGQVVDMAQAGVLDVASVQRAAVHGAVTTAALALTIDVLVHHREPELAAAEP